MCECPSGFIGSSCQTEIDDCSHNPYQNGALCIDTVNSFRCGCQAGFTGEICEVNVDCSFNPCQNGGTCMDGVCQCPSGFNGTSCEINIDNCSPNPCQNGAFCIDGINTFMCNCQNGFTGETVVRY